MSDTAQPIKSPCIEVCALDDHNVCIGCYRTADEIIDWFSASDDRKRDHSGGAAKTPSRERVVAPQSTYSAECSSKPASVSNGQIRTRLICVLAMSSISS